MTGGNPMDHYYDANGRSAAASSATGSGSSAAPQQGIRDQEVLGFAGAPGPGRRLLHGGRRAGPQADRENNRRRQVHGRSPRSKHRLSYMHHYDYKKTDDRDGNAFRPHEASGYYALPNTYMGEWIYT